MPRGTAGALNPCEYAVTNPANLELRLPAGTSPGHVPFRLIINGAESPPGESPPPPLSPPPAAGSSLV